MADAGRELSPLFVDGGALSVADVVAVARQARTAALSSQPDFVARIDAGAAFLARLLEAEGTVYGVTTGFGDSVTRPVPPALVPDLGRRLYTYHGVGLGEVLGPEETRAVLLARLQSLAQGVSGVSFELLRRIALFLEHDVLPRIPAEGSVGASGDLTPLSYLAATLCGEREVLAQGRVVPAGEALAALGVDAYRLRPKEGLAVMNGTAVMTGLACLAVARARALSRVAARVTALAVVGTQGNPTHFDERLFELKPHPGPRRVAGWIREDLGGLRTQGSRLQDRYSLRCAPHVIGALEDALTFVEQLVEGELNSANDNPLVDAEAERVLHGGHFYGGHVSLAMDTLKSAVASVADLLDRQLALLVDPRYSHGLPADLSGARGDEAAASHGFKAVQIATSAWAAEALKLTMPAASFSRSTESHNQDKVSMGTIAARDALRVLTLSEQVAAALLLATAQAVELRERAGEVDPSRLAVPVVEGLGAVRAVCPLVEADVALDRALGELAARLRQGRWPG